MKTKRYLSFLLSCALLGSTLTPQAAVAEEKFAWGERWLHLPATPAPDASLKTGYAQVNGIALVSMAPLARAVRLFFFMAVWLIPTIGAIRSR